MCGLSNAHLEKFSEVWTASREEHLVSRELLALHPQGDVHKLLLAQQTVEGRDQLPLVIVPVERISVIQGRPIQWALLTISSCIFVRSPSWRGQTRTDWWSGRQAGWVILIGLVVVGLLFVTHSQSVSQLLSAVQYIDCSIRALLYSRPFLRHNPQRENNNVRWSHLWK